MALQTGKAHRLVIIIAAVGLIGAIGLFLTTHSLTAAAAWAGILTLFLTIIDRAISAIRTQRNPRQPRSEKHTTPHIAAGSNANSVKGNNNVIINRDDR